MKYILVHAILVFGLFCFSQEVGFKEISSDQSTIHFTNTISENDDVNIMMYDYLYNGGGVGVGDFNNDGLSDVFFSGNMVNDKLYINKGSFVFEDISEQAGINSNGWSTGVCILDINNDGFDDIYVCRSGWFKDASKLENVLYVNQGDLTFKEASEEYGLNLKGHHTQAAPLDYDLDGDLDLYIIGHPGEFNQGGDMLSHIKDIQAGLVEGDVLMENSNGKFIDITQSAGIFEYGYSLGLAITDVNLDGYPDIIVCNDFDEPDHLFVNQRNGKFKDMGLDYFKHTSNYSMGNDVGDINNDGLLDFISVDMAYNSHVRSKINMASMNPAKFFARVSLGWNKQYMHNMLQLNTGLGVYQEIAQYSGVAKTDWSWAPLFFDIDMDGWQDLFVTNGYKRDTKNNDLHYLVEEEKEKNGDLTIEAFLELIPSVEVENFVYQNNGEYKFEDKRADWGIDKKINSNGIAYADFDNDGDLDIVLNNVDVEASIYENVNERKGHYLKIDLSSFKYSELLGMKFMLKTQKMTQIKEAYFVRGFQSTVEKKIYFYWDKQDELEYLDIELTSGLKFRVEKPVIDEEWKLNKEMFGDFKRIEEESNSKRWFKSVTNKYQLNHVAFENQYDDFAQEILLPHKMTTRGPFIKVADFNKDGREDFVVTSTIGKIPSVYIQSTLGTFDQLTSPSFYNHHSTEDGGIEVFDVNRDGNLDLYITSGGYQYDKGDSAYQDRLYIGNGLGMFGLVKNAIRDDSTNSGKPISYDIDGDGDLDFLVCGNADPKRYPYPGNTSIMINHKGYFTDKTEELAPGLKNIGMVNDAAFSDYDQDGDIDILLVGEWMNVEIFSNENGVFKRATNHDLKGWWSSIEAVDIDEDGDDDYLLGNAGMNNKFNASVGHELEVFANDFDGNGTLDIVLAKHGGESMLPVRGKECSTQQMPFIEQKFPTYSAFANSDLFGIYPSSKLDAALHYEVNEFRSGILLNEGKGSLSFEPFSAEAQFSFINDFMVIDINKDGLLDVLAIGNRFNTEVETTQYDANCGICLIQNSEGKFDFVAPRESGFFVPGNAKSMTMIHLGKEKSLGILVTNNKGALQLFELKD